MNPALKIRLWLNKQHQDLFPGHFQFPLTAKTTKYYFTPIHLSVSLKQQSPHLRGLCFNLRGNDLLKSECNRKYMVCTEEFSLSICIVKLKIKTFHLIIYTCTGSKTKSCIGFVNFRDVCISAANKE